MSQVARSDQGDSAFEADVWRAADRLASLGPLYQIIVLSGEIFNHRHDRLVRRTYELMAIRDAALIIALWRRGADQTSRRLLAASMISDATAVVCLHRARGARRLFSNPGVTQLGLSYAFVLSISDRSRRGYLHSLWGLASGVGMLALQKPNVEEARSLGAEFVPELLIGVVLVCAARSILVGSLSDYREIEEKLSEAAVEQVSRVSRFLRIHGSVLNEIGAAARDAPTSALADRIALADSDVRSLLLRSHLSSERVPLFLVLGDLMRRREAAGRASEWRGANALDPTIALSGDDARRFAQLANDHLLAEPSTIEYGAVVLVDRVELLIRGRFAGLSELDGSYGIDVDRSSDRTAIRLSMKVVP